MKIRYKILISILIIFLDAAIMYLWLCWLGGG